MTIQLEIVEERGSLRLIRCDPQGYAIVEARGGNVYSPDAHHEAAVPDSPSGMAAIGDTCGWMDAKEARRLFDGLVKQGHQLARTMW